ncbi:MAG: DMT family transporter [Clostridia bacterium]|nr:DMT family transporter [Clostridia bacterium]
MPKLNVNKKHIGILYIILSAFFFAGMNLFVKLSGNVPVPQKVFFRNLVAVFFSFIFLMRAPSAFKTGKGHIFDLFMRAFVGTVGVFGNFYALSSGVSVADASILNKLSPFFAIIFTFFLLKEKPKIT